MPRRKHYSIKNQSNHNKNQTKSRDLKATEDSSTSQPSTSHSKLEGKHLASEQASASSSEQKKIVSCAGVKNLIDSLGLSGRIEPLIQKQILQMANKLEKKQVIEYPGMALKLPLEEESERNLAKLDEIIQQLRKNLELLKNTSEEKCRINKQETADILNKAYLISDKRALDLIKHLKIQKIQLYLNRLYKEECKKEVNNKNIIQSKGAKLTSKENEAIEKRLDKTILKTQKEITQDEKKLEYLNELSIQAIVLSEQTLKDFEKQKLLATTEKKENAQTEQEGEVAVLVFDYQETKNRNLRNNLEETMKSIEQKIQSLESHSLELHNNTQEKEQTNKTLDGMLIHKILNYVRESTNSSLKTLDDIENYKRILYNNKLNLEKFKEENKKIEKYEKAIQDMERIIILQERKAVSNFGALHKITMHATLMFEEYEEQRLLEQTTEEKENAQTEQEEKTEKRVQQQIEKLELQKNTQEGTDEIIRHEKNRQELQQGSIQKLEEYQAKEKSIEHLKSMLEILKQDNEENKKKMKNESMTKSMPAMEIAIVTQKIEENDEVIQKLELEIKKREEELELQSKKIEETKQATEKAKQISKENEENKEIQNASMNKPKSEIERARVEQKIQMHNKLIQGLEETITKKEEELEAIKQAAERAKQTSKENEKSKKITELTSKMDPLDSLPNSSSCCNQDSVSIIDYFGFVQAKIPIFASCDQSTDAEGTHYPGQDMIEHNNDIFEDIIRKIPLHCKAHDLSSAQFLLLLHFEALTSEIYLLSNINLEIPELNDQFYQYSSLETPDLTFNHTKENNTEPNNIENQNISEVLKSLERYRSLFIRFNTFLAQLTKDHHESLNGKIYLKLVRQQYQELIHNKIHKLFRLLERTKLEDFTEHKEFIEYLSSLDLKSKFSKLELNFKSFLSNILKTCFNCLHAKYCKLIYDAEIYNETVVFTTNETEKKLFETYKKDKIPISELNILINNELEFRKSIAKKLDNECLYNETFVLNIPFNYYVTLELYRAFLEYKLETPEPIATTYGCIQEHLTRLFKFAPFQVQLLAPIIIYPLEKIKTLINASESDLRKHKKVFEKMHKKVINIYSKKTTKEEVINEFPLSQPTTSLNNALPEKGFNNDTLQANILKLTKLINFCVQLRTKEKRLFLDPVKIYNKFITIKNSETIALLEERVSLVKEKMQEIIFSLVQEVPKQVCEKWSSDKISLIFSNEETITQLIKNKITKCISADNMDDHISFNSLIESIMKEALKTKSIGNVNTIYLEESDMKLARIIKESIATVIDQDSASIKSVDSIIEMHRYLSDMPEPQDELETIFTNSKNLIYITAKLAIKPFKLLSNINVENLSKVYDSLNKELQDFLLCIYTTQILSVDSNNEQFIEGTINQFELITNILHKNIEEAFKRSFKKNFQHLGISIQLLDKYTENAMKKFNLKDLLNIINEKDNNEINLHGIVSYCSKIIEKVMANNKSTEKALSTEKIDKDRYHHLTQSKREYLQKMDEYRYYRHPNQSVSEHLQAIDKFVDCKKQTLQDLSEGKGTKEEETQYNIDLLSSKYLKSSLSAALNLFKALNSETMFLIKQETSPDENLKQQQMNSVKQDIVKQSESLMEEFINSHLKNGTLPLSQYIMIDDFLCWFKKQNIESLTLQDSFTKYKEETAKKTKQAMEDFDDLIAIKQCMKGITKCMGDYIKHSERTNRFNEAQDCFKEIYRIVTKIKEKHSLLEIKVNIPRFIRYFAFYSTSEDKENCKQALDYFKKIYTKLKEAEREQVTSYEDQLDILYKELNTKLKDVEDYIRKSKNTHWLKNAEICLKQIKEIMGKGDDQFIYEVFLVVYEEVYGKDFDQIQNANNPLHCTTLDNATETQEVDTKLPSTNATVDDKIYSKISSIHKKAFENHTTLPTSLSSASVETENPSTLVCK